MGAYRRAHRQLAARPTGVSHSGLLNRCASCWLRTTVCWRDGVKAELAGFAVDWVRDGEAALAAVAAMEPPSCSTSLPRRDGLSVLAALRAAGKSGAVLVLTARDQVADKVRCPICADDYVVKPF